MLVGQEAKGWSIPLFPGLFFHSNLIVQQRPVQDSAEAEEDLDLKWRTPAWRRAGMRVSIHVLREESVSPFSTCFSGET